MASELRIGLTMREVSAEGYNEPRDALARVWGEFLQVAVPEAAWLPVPNLGPASAPLFCDRWDINALILTGGEDIGVSPVRDATERGLLQHFARNGRPVFGVCRGLQLMWTELGGDLEINGGHVAVRHHVRYARENALHIEDRIAMSTHSMASRCANRPRVCVSRSLCSRVPMTGVPKGCALATVAWQASCGTRNANNPRTPQTYP